MSTQNEFYRFKAWAEANGGVVEPETSEYEKARISHADGVLVIYEGKRGLGFSDSVAHKSWAAFKRNMAFKFNKRHKRTKTESTVTRLKARDEDKCWFCGCSFNDENQATIEHLLSIKHGGSNNINNLVLACQSCNGDAGSLSIAEKVKLRETKQREVLIDEQRTS